MKKNNLFSKYFKKYSYDVDKVVGIDPLDFSNNFLIEDGVIKKISPKNIKEEYLISTHIPIKNVIIYELQIPKNIEEKVFLDDYIETKCYEELGLDEAEEYIFKYKIVDNITDEKNLLAEVIVVPKKDSLEEYFSPLIKRVDHIDYINYFGWVFGVLYKTKLLEPQKDMYIYFDKDEVSVSLYNEGKFLHTFVVPGGLESLYFSLEENLKIKQFNYDKFMNVLLKRGLEIDNYPHKEQVLFHDLSELFSNKFLIISNQLNSVIRKFSLGTIDRVFITTSKGLIPGVNEFANMYLGVEANDLKFDTNYNPNNIAIDQILFLNMLYASHAYKRDDQEDNFTIFERYPTFFYRKSGQFISVAVASLIVSLIYPSIQVAQTYFTNKNIQKEQLQLNNLNKQKDSLYKAYKAYKQKLSEGEAPKKRLVSYNKKIENIILNMYINKKNYVPKARLLAKLSK